MVEKFAAGDSDITSEATGGGDVPSDPAPLTTSSETPDTAAAAAAGPTTVSDASSLSPDPEGDASSLSLGGVSSSSTDGEGGKGVESEGVLLEPGVGSVDELFESDVFTKVAGSRGKSKKEQANESS